MPGRARAGRVCTSPANGSGHLPNGGQAQLRGGLVTLSGLQRTWGGVKCSYMVVTELCHGVSRSYGPQFRAMQKHSRQKPFESLSSKVDLAQYMHKQGISLCITHPCSVQRSVRVCDVPGGGLTSLRGGLEDGTLDLPALLEEVEGLGLGIGIVVSSLMRGCRNEGRVQSEECVC